MTIYPTAELRRYRTWLFWLFARGQGLWETLRAPLLLYVEPIDSITNTPESRTQEETRTKPKIGRQSDCVFQRKM